MNELDSKAAAAYLGVKKTTLYAYVSRGLLQSIQHEGDTRRRFYRKADLDRLKQRSDAHAGEAAAAASAMSWGAPVLDTAITEITPNGPVYRGHLARDLARSFTFPRVAELLWTGEDPGPVTWKPPETVMAPSPPLPPIDRMRLALLEAELTDRKRFSTLREHRIECGRRMIGVLATAWLDRPLRSVAGLAPADADVDNSVLDAALIAVADHELNASTFAARVAASTGAGIYAAASAGFAALTGPKHGGSADRCEALIDEVIRAGSASRALELLLRRGESVPGFGHPLYPDGDPRWRIIVSRLDDRASTSIVDVLDDIVEAGARFGLAPPNIDLGLAGLSRSFGWEPGSASAVFALGRSAGWVAHALEQYEQGVLLRPRGHFKP